MNTYQLIDSGLGQKLEKFGPYLLKRPAAQAFWLPVRQAELWDQAVAIFSREEEMQWTFKASFPKHWTIQVAGITFRIEPTNFGHLGIFPEQMAQWEWIQKTIALCQRRPKVLNLFAYSGGATLAAAKAGAEVVHLDSSRGMVEWARENAALNGLSEAPIRWIVDDVTKFLKRELRRGSSYDGIILDPPSFGRGTKGEVFKIEVDIIPLLSSCRELLSKEPLFFLLSCHSEGFTPLAMRNLLDQMLGKIGGILETGEMVLPGASGTFDLPSGSFARWCHE